VRHVAARAVDGGQTPAHVVDQLDGTLAGASAAFSDDGATRDGVQATEAATNEVVALGRPDEWSPSPRAARSTPSRWA
jgi:hypothetical protein